jgi:hypothetical protein
MIHSQQMPFLGQPGYVQVQCLVFSSWVHCFLVISEVVKELNKRNIQICNCVIIQLCNIHIGSSLNNKELKRMAISDKRFTSH